MLAAVRVAVKSAVVMIFLMMVVGFASECSDAVLYGTVVVNQVH